MVRIGITIVLILTLCVLVVLNLDYKTSVNLFWRIFDNVSVVVVALVSFVAGVLYSFLLYAARFFAGLRKNALANRRSALDQREKEASAQEAAAAAKARQGDAAVAGDPAAADAAATGAPAARRKKPRWRSR